MERYTDTVQIDTLRKENSSWMVDLFRDGETAYPTPVFIEGETLELPGRVEIEFGEHYTMIRAEMEVEVSYVEREYDSKPYTEDHRLDSLTVLDNA